MGIGSPIIAKVEQDIREEGGYAPFETRKREARV